MFATKVAPTDLYITRIVIPAKAGIQRCMHPQVQASGSSRTQHNRRIVIQQLADILRYFPGVVGENLSLAIIIQ